jgi:hypothetical protein
MSTWGVTVERVLEATGRNVTLTNIAMAGEIIDLYSNRTEDASASMRPRDRTWLAKAVVWQSVKCADEPDLAGKMAPQKIVQGSDMANLEVNVTRDSAWILAPLAARALKNLSWKGWRTRRPHTAREALGQLVLPFPFEEEASDEFHRWESE